MTTTTMLWTAARRCSWTASSSAFAAASLPVALASSCLYEYATEKRLSTNCEQAATTKAKDPRSSSANLKTRMTSIGRFSLQSESTSNPSLPTFFIALATDKDKPFRARDFVDLWRERNMEQRHPRFHLRVSETTPGHFEPMEDNTIEMHVRDTLPPVIYRTDLMRRLQTCLTDPLHVFTSLWQVQISSEAPLGSSGAISKCKTDQIRLESPNAQEESLLIFRGHHALADGVSLAAAFMELTDEAEELQQMVVDELQKRRKKKQSLTFWQKLALYLKRMMWFFNGSVMAFWHQLYLFCITPRNPFDEIKWLLPPLTTTTTTMGMEEITEHSTAIPPRRSLSFCDATTVDEVKRVARYFGPKVTVNDVWVSCVSYAVAKQLEEHRKYLNAIRQDDNDDKHEIKPRKHVNVVIPVHLKGGLLLPGESVGNKIGAFTARVPTEDDTLTPSDRLLQVHKSLSWVKQTPAPFLSYGFAKVASNLPSRLTRWLFASINANACVAITNVRGSPKKLHLQGRSVESTAGFLPLPPNIPIGCAVQSYAGVISLTVTAEPWAVPNADEFLRWVLEEYQRLAVQAGEVKQS